MIPFDRQARLLWPNLAQLWSDQSLQKKPEYLNHISLT